MPSLLKEKRKKDLNPLQIEVDHNDQHIVKDDLSQIGTPINKHESNFPYDKKIIFVAERNMVENNNLICEKSTPDSSLKFE